MAASRRAERGERDGAAGAPPASRQLSPQLIQDFGSTAEGSGFDRRDSDQRERLVTVELACQRAAHASVRLDRPRLQPYRTSLRFAFNGLA
jgi:hypothetical protein